MPLLEFIRGQHGNLPYMASSAARNHVKSLLKKHWDEFVKARGLRAFETASRQYAWYPPRGLIPDETVRFLDVCGSKKRRALIGWSEKRRVHWHFAIEATPVLVEPMHFTFKPHVIFTEDGKSPISSDARMHSLRRGFCKSWWNDRWRDLTAAFAAWLANGEQEIVIAIAGNLDLRLRSDLTTLTAPVSLRAEGLAAPESSSEQVDADWLDDPELDDTELEALNGPTEPLNPSEEAEDYDS